MGTHELAGLLLEGKSGWRVANHPYLVLGTASQYSATEVECPTGVEVIISNFISQTATTAQSFYYAVVSSTVLDASTATVTRYSHGPAGESATLATVRQGKSTSNSSPSGDHPFMYGGVNNVYLYNNELAVRLKAGQIFVAMNRSANQTIAGVVQWYERSIP